MRRVPGPRAFNDLFQLWKSRFPSEDLTRFSRIADKLWRVVGTTRRVLNRDLAACHFFCGVDDLLYRVSVAVPEIYELRLFSRSQMIECKQVCA